MESKLTPTWQNTLNTSLKWHGHVSVAAAMAKDAGYPFFTWNGWVYETTTQWCRDKDRVILVEDLK